MNLNRRQMMQLSAAGLASCSFIGCSDSGRNDQNKTLPAIDAHSHVWSDDLDQYPLGSWATAADMQPATFTADELLAIAQPNGVDRVVLIQHAPLHGYDNSYILDCARERPDTFSVVAMIDERTPNLPERLRDLRDQGARGIRIGPTNHADRTLNVDPPNWLNAEGMQLLWQHAIDLGVAVCPLVSAEFLPTLDPMCEKFPETVCVIDHFGRIDMNKPDTIESLTNLAKHPNVYVKVSAFYKFGDGVAPYDDLIPMINRVVDAFGADRLMWGSDCPYQLNDGNNYADAVELVRNGLAELSDAERRAILCDTAARVFFAEA